MQFLCFSFFVNYFFILFAFTLTFCTSIRCKLMLFFIGFYCAVKPGLKRGNLIDTYNYEFLLNSQTY